MNYRKVLYYLGYILLAEAALLLLPLLVALLYGESVLPFLYTVLITAVAGGVLLLRAPKNNQLYAKEGFFIVSAGWILMTLFGCLPYLFSGTMHNFPDAWFETVSGLTTTGASVIADVEALPHGILFWRSFTQWIGGMGVLVFLMAVLPLSNDHSMHVMRAEIPGHSMDKLMPRTRTLAAWMYGIYTGLTLLEAVLLKVGGMPLFDSIAHAMTTTSTGGFSVRNGGLIAYDNPYFNTVILVFMLLCGINFNVFIMLIVRKFRSVLKNEELWVYLGITVLVSLMISLNIFADADSYGQSLFDAAFQTVSMMTTTGFATVDFNFWPSFSKELLLVLMLLGGCAGSTAGGFKISRVIILCKRLWSGLMQALHPRTVHPIKLDGRRVDTTAVENTQVFLLAYLAIFFVVQWLISLDAFSVEANLSATVSCLTNAGTGLAEMGAMATFDGFSGFSKIVLSLTMLLGRLEIFPILLFLTPAMYRKQ